MDPIDALDRARRQMLWAVVVTTALWLLPQVVLTSSPEPGTSSWRQALTWAAMIGALAWMFFMWRYHRFRRGLLEDPSAAEQLDDERVRDVRRESIYRSWFVLVVATGVGVAASALADLPAQPILLALLLIAVEAPLVFFLCLDRD